MLAHKVAAASYVPLIQYVSRLGNVVADLEFLLDCTGPGAAG
jgi:hypothetical protein